MNVADFDGLLVLDKPTGITSRTVVDHVQRWFPKRTKIGHAGTLDPLATGVLVLCLGSATRLIEYVQRMKKVYRTTLLLGARSESDDADGVITPVSGVTPADPATVSECVAAFVGVLSQVPPAYSAAKVAGQRAYDLARRGEEVALLPHSVQIYAIEIQHYAYPYLELEVCCGKGTYIRSLARDIGERLGCGALVQKLRRTRIGPFATDEAVTPADDAQTGRAHLLPPEMAVSELPRLVLPGDELRRLMQGQAVATQPQGMRSRTEVAVFDTVGSLFAVAVLDPQRQTLQPVKVFQPKKPE